MNPGFSTHPHIPTLQAQNCPTFRPPPIDGSYTVPELFEYNATHNPDHPVFVYADGDNGKVFLCYSDMWKMIRRAATYIHSHYQCVEARYAEQKCSRPVTLGPTIAILASADTISYVTLMLGIMRLGLVPFPLSIRNTAAGIAHLIRTNHVLQVYVSEDAATQRLCSGAVEILEQDGWHLDVVVMMQFDQLSDLRSGTAETEPDVTLGRLDLNKVVVISHSSGSTSVPKPIFIDNRTFLQYTMIPWFGEVDFCGTVVGMHVVPLFHTMGLANMTWPVASGMIIGVFKPSIPPVIPTPENYIEGIMATDTKVLFCVPSFVEAWFCDADLIPALKSLRAIVYGGAPLNKAVGDELIKIGVAVFPSYGTTEIGTFNMFIPSTIPPLDYWEYFEISPHLTVEMVPQDGLPDVCEPIVVHTEYFKPNVINARSRDGRGAFRTKDLLQHHPQDRSRWRMYGRVDDQILLSTGEKTNPVPLEMILSQDPHLVGAVIFGQGRFQTGVLVEPKDDLKFNPDDQLKLIDFRNKIWPSVERVNKSAPGHSRLMKEMILVAHPSKPFSYTAKGTPRRQMVIDTYKSEIDTLYSVVEYSAQTDIPIPTAWTTDELLEFVGNVVRRATMTDMPDDVDLFQYGCDSMQATYIRNSIMHALRVSAQNPLRDIPINFVYTHPTIASLVTFMLHFRHDVVAAFKYSEDEGQHATRMESMLAKYSNEYHSRRSPTIPNECAGHGDTVLLTGSTGRLGCHLLCQIIGMPSVRKVYALNRGTSMSALEARQKDALRAWGLDTQLLDSEKVCLLVADLEKSDLGLGHHIYEEVQRTVTRIIHNAWHVNFNLMLASFEPLVAGVRNLINFSLSSPLRTTPSILFVSSISVLQNQPSSPSPIPERPVKNVAYAVGTGYGEGKWVAEQVLLRAPSVPTTIVRVGQLCGDTVHGGWGEKEWVPSMLERSLALGAIPMRDEVIDWIPVDIAARTLLEMACSTAVQKECARILHLVHPYPIPWRTFSNHASKMLSLPSVPYTEWVTGLKQQVALGEYPLMEFFEQYKNTMISTECAVKVSKTLKEAKKVEKEDVRKWIEFWRQRGLFKL